MSVLAVRASQMHFASYMFEPRTAIDRSVLDIKIEFPVRCEWLSEPRHALHAEPTADVHGALKLELLDGAAETWRQGRDEFVAGSQTVDVDVRRLKLPLLVGQGLEATRQFERRFVMRPPHLFQFGNAISKPDSPDDIVQLVRQPGWFDRDAPAFDVLIRRMLLPDDLEGQILGGSLVSQLDGDAVDRPARMQRLPEPLGIRRAGVSKFVFERHVRGIEAQRQDGSGHGVRPPTAVASYKGAIVVPFEIREGPLVVVPQDRPGDVIEWILEMLVPHRTV